MVYPSKMRALELTVNFKAVMNYVQTQEQSAVILRSVVSLMAAHQAAFNPLTYTIWYEHVAGINSALS
jgi:diguanylate cyclase